MQGRGGRQYRLTNEDVKNILTRQTANIDQVSLRVQNGSPGSTRFYGPVHLRRYWSVPVSTGPYILGRPVKFSNSQDTYHSKEDANTFPMTPGSLTP